jgi:hypothetical protein
MHLDIEVCRGLRSIDQERECRCGDVQSAVRYVIGPRAIERNRTGKRSERVHATGTVDVAIVGCRVAVERIQPRVRLYRESWDAPAVL